MMQYQAFPMVSGEQADALVFDFAAPSYFLNRSDIVPIIFGISLAAEAPAFGWTIYLRSSASTSEEHTVVLDSINPIPTTVVDPVAAPVVYRSMNCKRVVERDTAGLPMQLRVTTSGKTGVGILYLKWEWVPMGQL